MESLEIAPLSRRWLAASIDVGIVIGGAAAVGATAHVLGRSFRLHPPRWLTERAWPRAQSNADQLRKSIDLALSAVDLSMRNWRTPGARLAGIRVVDARTGGPITVRSAVIAAAVREVTMTPARILGERLSAPHRTQLAQLHSRLEEVDRSHDGDQEAITRAKMRLYKEAGANPIAACGWPMVTAMVTTTLPRLLSRRRQSPGEWLAGIVTVVDHDRGP